MKCLEIDPSKRIGYSQLISNIESYLLNQSFEDTKMSELDLSIKLKNNELMEVERFQHYYSFLSVVSDLLDKCFAALKKTYKNELIMSVTHELSIQRHIDYCAKNGPHGSITTFSRHDMIIRIDFLGEMPNEYIKVDFLKKYHCFSSCRWLLVCL